MEYYYDDKADPALKSRVDEYYAENYDNEQKKANKTEPLVAYMPELHDYTLEAEFRDPFKAMPQVCMTAAYKYS